MIRRREENPLCLSVLVAPSPPSLISKQQEQDPQVKAEHSEPEGVALTCGALLLQGGARRGGRKKYLTMDSMKVYTSTTQDTKEDEMERPRKQYTVQIEDDVIERIDRLAAEMDLSRSQLMRNLIMIGLEDAEILNKTPLMKVAKIERYVREKFLTDIVGGRLTLNKKGDWKVNK
ncbi:MAG TPA: ribbon-helix-helix protein, CopG family [Syntrophales bacterium]|nr:ribbon-helix-helix protein, CopG family [Syntrophales bacterium]